MAIIGNIPYFQTYPYVYVDCENKNDILNTKLPFVNQGQGCNNKQPVEPQRAFLTMEQFTGQPLVSRGAIDRSSRSNGVT